MSNNIKEKIVGTWKLSHFSAESTSGNIFYPFGEAPTGRIIYTEGGKVLKKRGRIYFLQRPLFKNQRDR